MASTSRGSRLGRTPLVLAMLAAGACALGDILAPGPGTLAVSRLASLAILPADTLLAERGDRFCYRAEARDSGGMLVPDLTPKYFVTEGASLIEATDEGCVVAIGSGASPARVVGRLGSLTATGTVRVPIEATAALGMRP